MSTDAKRNAVRVSRRVECTLMPDIVVPVVVDPEPTSGANALEPDSTEGFNPYDTGVLYKK